MDGPGWTPRLGAGLRSIMEAGFMVHMAGPGIRGLSEGPISGVRRWLDSLVLEAALVLDSDSEMSVGARWLRLSASTLGTEVDSGLEDALDAGLAGADGRLSTTRRS